MRQRLANYCHTSLRTSICGDIGRMIAELGFSEYQFDISAYLWIMLKEKVFMECAPPQLSRSPVSAERSDLAAADLLILIVASVTDRIPTSPKSPIDVKFSNEKCSHNVIIMSTQKVLSLKPYIKNAEI